MKVICEVSKTTKWIKVEEKQLELLLSYAEKSIDDTILSAYPKEEIKLVSHYLKINQKKIIKPKHAAFLSDDKKLGKDN